ncbi:hypothetical protein [Achromobacter sp. Marseille-Q4954]|uniref:hypothetical protein n=1 Tax=Achromobacter sp. Marseille-Q4954 TaxID=2942203 RepID=UPI0020737D84|nr:hypothetical protein [Achromobacter sp. Marseille-Q4954]
MADLVRELTVGAAGSVIGAAVVYFASSAAGLGKVARQAAAEKRKLEIDLWKTRKIQVRMEITNYYLFEVLKAFLFGSILTIIPSIGAMAISQYFGGLVYLVLAGLTAVGLIYYFIGLGHVLRYLAIRRSDEDYLKTYVSTPPDA